MIGTVHPKPGDPASVPVDCAAGVSLTGGAHSGAQRTSTTTSAPIKPLLCASTHNLPVSSGANVATPDSLVVCWICISLFRNVKKTITPGTGLPADVTTTSIDPLTVATPGALIDSSGCAPVMPFCSCATVSRIAMIHKANIHQHRMKNPIN